MDIRTEATELVRVAFTVVDGPHTYMNTLEYPTAKPLTLAQVRTRIEAEFGAWKATVETPLPKRTAVDIQADIARAEKDVVRAVNRKVVLAAELAAVAKTRVVEV